MIKELEQFELVHRAHQKSQKEQEKSAKQNMLELMTKYYNNLKNEVGIEDNNDHEDQDFELD